MFFCFLKSLACGTKNYIKYAYINASPGATGEDTEQ